MKVCNDPIKYTFSRHGTVQHKPRMGAHAVSGASAVEFPGEHRAPDPELHSRRGTR
jgi:hypothetical protein